MGWWKYIGVLACGGRFWRPLRLGRLPKTPIWSERWSYLGWNSSGCPGRGRSVWRAGSAWLGRRQGGDAPQWRTKIPGGSGTGLSCGGFCTWCNLSTRGISRISVGPCWQCVRSLGWRRRLLQPRWTGQCLGGWIFHAWQEDFKSHKFWVDGQGAYTGCSELGRWRDLRGRGGHPGGGSLQLTPMPDKPTLFQVGPIGAWSTGCFGPGARRLGGVLWEGGWILESRIYQKGITEFIPLLVQPLLLHILSSSHSHGFLHSVETTHEISSSGGGGYLSQNERLWVFDRHIALGPSSPWFLNERLTKARTAPPLPGIKRVVCCTGVPLPLAPRCAWSGASPPISLDPFGPCSVEFLGCSQG